jgi:plasmid stabilization system protein ParE
VTQPQLPVVITWPAEKQIEEAHAWWRANRPAAPDAILEELGRALPLISSQPGAGISSPSARFTGVRRILLLRVGYFLYYRLAPRRREIQVLALWHAQRAAAPRL